MRSTESGAGQDSDQLQRLYEDVAIQENQKLANYNKQLRNAQFDNNALRQGLSQLDTSILPTLQQYESQLGLNRQQILEQYDPTRLSRIQALQQLTGSAPFDPLLQTRLT